jgi:ABC-type Fe3+-hydroxamate transport system substrate-binding protein
MGISPSDFAKNSRQFIAACSSSIMGQLLALGVIPMSAPLDPKWTPYYYNVYSAKIKSHLKITLPYNDNNFEINIVKLIQTRPDAIIGTDRLCLHEQNKLTDIAPALIVPEEAGWRDQLRMIARFLDREVDAEQWIEQYKRKAQYAQRQVQQVLTNDKIVAIRIYGQSTHVYRNRGLEDVLYRDLKLNEAYSGDESSKSEITLQELAKLAPDRILIAVCPEASSRKYWLSLQHSTEWKKLKAVANRHVYTISADPWFEYSALAITRMLDEALLLFTGNCPNAFMDISYGESCAK